MHNRGARTLHRSKPSKQHSLTVKIIVAALALLIVCVIADIIQLYEVYLHNKPPCTKNEDCASQSAKKKYLAAIDDPKYTLTEGEIKQFGFVDLHIHLDCFEHATNESKPVYSEDVYHHMRDKYTELTGYIFKPLTYEQDVFHIDFAEKAGRGVFASREIKKGEIIPFDATCSVVTFLSGQLWKDYVMSLPRTLGCDVMEWTWTQNVHTLGDIRLCLSIGGGDSFLNDADVDEDINIVPTNATSMKFEAARDIKMGEELIYDYEVFEPTQYERFGLGTLP